jgi:hypothetical protein
MVRALSILGIVDEEIDVVIVQKNLWQRTLIERDVAIAERKNLERIVAAIEEGR